MLPPPCSARGRQRVECQPLADGSRPASARDSTAAPTSASSPPGGCCRAPVYGGLAVIGTIHFDRPAVRIISRSAGRPWCTRSQQPRGHRRRRPGRTSTMRWPRAHAPGLQVALDLGLPAISAGPKVNAASTAPAPGMGAGGASETGGIHHHQVGAAQLGRKPRRAGQRAGGDASAARRAARNSRQAASPTTSARSSIGSSSAREPQRRLCDRVDPGVRLRGDRRGRCVSLDLWGDWRQPRCATVTLDSRSATSCRLMGLERPDRAGRGCCGRSTWPVHLARALAPRPADPGASKGGTAAAH